MFSFLGWLIVGIVAGLIARALVPGRQAMGLMMTMLLGLAGSIVGGFISTMVFGEDPMNPGFHAGGLIMSTLGAVGLLAIYISLNRRRMT